MKWIFEYKPTSSSPNIHTPVTYVLYLFIQMDYTCGYIATSTTGHPQRYLTSWHYMSLSEPMHILHNKCIVNYFVVIIRNWHYYHYCVVTYLSLVIIALRVPSSASSWCTHYQLLTLSTCSLLSLDWCSIIHLNEQVKHYCSLVILNMFITTSVYMYFLLTDIVMCMHTKQKCHIYKFHMQFMVLRLSIMWAKWQVCECLGRENSQIIIFRSLHIHFIFWLSHNEVNIWV